LRCAGIKHVVIAEEGASDMGDLKTRVSTPIHVLTLSTAQSVPEGILVNCRRVQRKTTGKLRFWKERSSNGLDISGFDVKNQAQ